MMTGGKSGSHMEETGMLVGTVELNPKRRQIWTWLNSGGGGGGKREYKKGGDTRREV